MAPAVDFTIWATPVFLLPAWKLAGQATVSPGASVNTVGAALARYLVKALVVPEPSARWTTTMGVDGRVALALSALMAGSFQVLIVPWKMPASVAGLSWSLATPLMLYATVIGALAVGK